MKYKLLRLSLLSMLFMFFGGWTFAQEPAVTLDFTSQDNWNIPTDGTNKALASFTDGTYTIKLCASTSYKLNKGYLLLGKSGSFLELPPVDFDVAKIEVVGTSGASASVVQYISNGNGNALVGVPETTGAKDVTNVYEFTGENQKARVYRINVNSNHNTQISKVFIYKAGTTAKTVTFVNDANWNKVYVWAWNDTENFTGGTWPGVEITPDNDGKYTWSTTGDPTKIIFNDGGQNQTADLPFEDGAIYKSQGKVFNATFTTNAEWNNVYAYAWTGDGNSATKFLGEWPGTQLTKDDATGKYTLSFEATEAPAKILFNNGNNGEGNQTEDLDFVNGKDYVYTVLPTYTSIAAMLADITSTKTDIKYQFEKLLVTYVNGSNTFVSDDGQNGFLFYGSNLGLVQGCTYSGSATGQLYTYNGLPELAISANDINATKLAEGAGVSWKIITPADIQNNINVPVIIENAVFVEAGTGKNLSFSVEGVELAVYNNWSIDVTALVAGKAYTLKGIGCIYVKNDVTTYQLYLDSFEEYVEPVVDNNYYILGDFWGGSFEDAPQVMTQSAEAADVYTLVSEVTVEGKKYEYKLRQGDNWEGYQLPAKGNYDFVFGTEEYPAGTYTLTFTANITENTLQLSVERDALEKAKAEFAKFIAEVEALYNQHKDDVPAESQAEVEQAIQDAKDALNSPNATVESLAQAQADLQAAMQKAQSDALGLDENVTDKFDIELNWISEMGAVTDYKNGNENLKEVWLDTTTDTGKVIHKTVEKLENGTYEVKLIGGALFTGNGETAALQADEEGRVMIYANNVALSIPVKFAQEGNAEHYQLDNVVVSDGQMEIGMEKLAAGSNRHFIQIEKVKMRSNTRQVADEEGQNNHWKGIAQTILGYEAYNNVKGVERANLVAAETKAAVMEAIPPFYAAKASYDALVQAIADAQAANIDVTEAQAVLNAAETTAAIAAAKAEELKAQMPAEQNAEITTVALCGEFNNWTATEGTTMTKGDQENVWTTTLDLTDITGDQKFKLVVNDEWIGNGQITIDAPDGWVDSAYDQYNNLVLKNSTTGYKTYNVTATWTPNTSATEGWTLKFEGKDQREGTANAEISKVELRGDFNNWIQSDKDVPFILTKGETENVWTGTLDLTEMTYDPKFKLVVNENGWIGNQEMQIDAPDGWVDSAYDQDNNLKIQHSITGYNTYTVTATWEPNANANSGWTLKFEGKDQKNPVVMQDFSIIFTTNADWEDVYAYAWNDGGEVLGTWPGTKMSYDKRYSQYELSFQAADAPKWIIFNNGTGGDTNTQTENLDFENQKSYTYTVEKPLLAEGDYYLYNVAADGYVVGANNWGTRASISKIGGIKMQVKQYDGKYELKTESVYPGKHLGFNGFVDNGDANQNWMVTAVDGQEGVFTLHSDGTKVLFWDGGETTTTTVGDMPETAANAYWKFVTKEEREALFANATAENPVDATFYITNPNFGRNSSNGMWNDSPSLGGDDENYNGEKFNSTFDVYQTLTGLKEGVYQLRLQGFYRQGGDGPSIAETARKAGEERLIATYYAGDKEKTLMSIFEEAGKQDVGSSTDLGKVPDSQSDATKFMSAGLYENEPINDIIVIGGTLKIGIKKSEAITKDWTLFDNIRLFYTGPVPADEYKTAYEAALAAAQAALQNADYANVTGEERTALEAVVQQYASVKDSKDAYEAAAIALNQATNTFTSAKGAYDGLATAKNFVANLSYQYATAEKKSAAENAAAAVASKATEATEMTAAVFKAYRQYAESSAMLEGVENATDFTSYIVNPKAEQAISEPWSVVLGEGSGGSLTILNGEPWTDGDDNSTHPYFDGGNWGAQAWDVSMKQDITLPAGKYQLTVKSRANTDMKNFTLFAGENKTEMQHISASGGLFNRGWNDASVEFELTEPAAITIGVQGVSEKQYQWMSFSDFRLVSFDKYEPVYTVAGAYQLADQEETAEFFGKTWDPSQEANDMVKDNDGNYMLAFSGVKLVPGGTIFYKVVESHSWVLPSWGFNGGNADYVVNLPDGKTLPAGTDKGIFNIVFKFNPKTVFDNKFNVDCIVEYDEATTTGIKTIDNSLWTNDNVIYNLSGQKVTKVKKGLYIVNGKKVVRK